MKTDDLDRMDATARNGSTWPESTQSRADVLTLTAEVRRLRAELTAERTVSASLREQLASLTWKVLGQRLLLGVPATQEDGR